MDDPQHFTEAQQQASEPEYFDRENRPVSLDKLCRDEPAWAANRLREDARSITDLEAANATLREQLPEGMKHCTIRFIECDLGHARLTATNWIDTGCPFCLMKNLQAQLAEREGEVGQLNAELYHEQMRLFEHGLRDDPRIDSARQAEGGEKD